MAAKATKLKSVGGRAVSARSKSGDPACSEAVSQWRRKGGGMTSAIAKVLARCRAKSKQNRAAANKQASGKLAAGRGTWQRSERAQAILEQRRAARASARPSLRDQADAKRQSKGDKVWRAREILGRMQKAYQRASANAKRAIKAGNHKLAEAHASAAEKHADRMLKVAPHTVPTAQKAAGRGTEDRKNQARVKREMRSKVQKLRDLHGRAHELEPNHVSREVGTIVGHHSVPYLKQVHRRFVGTETSGTNRREILDSIEAKIHAARAERMPKPPSAAERHAKQEATRIEGIRQQRDQYPPALEKMRGRIDSLKAAGKHQQAAELQNDYDMLNTAYQDRVREVAIYEKRQQKQSMAAQAGIAELPTAPISGGHSSTPAPITLRQQAEYRRLARGLTGETRARVARKLKASRKALSAATIDPSTHTNHAPGTVTDLHVEHINHDPGRFQYKLAHGETGSVGSLSGVRKYDPELGGVLQVWKDPANGKTYVVNGHNRLDLAKKLGAAKVTVRFIHAPTAEHARATGALTNIAEGRGTSVDAAKFFRDTGHTQKSIEEAGIPLRERIATEGIALSKLHDPIFKRVINGDMSPERGAIIGGAGLQHHEQEALVGLLDKAPKSKQITNGHLRELVDTVRSSKSATKHTFDLFGDSHEETSLALHKAKLQEQIKDRLSREKRLFGTVAKSRHAEELARAGNQINTTESGKISHEAATALSTFDLLKNRSGPISRALNEGAERIHKGEHAKKVHEDTYRRIFRELPEVLSGGSAFTA